MIKQYMKLCKLLSGLLLVSIEVSSLYADYTVWGRNYDQHVQQGYIANPNEETLYYEIRNQQVNFGYYEYLVILKNASNPLTVDFCIDEQMNIVHPEDYSISMHIPIVRQILYCGIYQSLELDKVNSSTSELIFEMNFNLSGSEDMETDQNDTWINIDGTFVLNPR